MAGPADARGDWPAAVRAAVAGGADWVQVRDRALEAGALLAFTRTLAEAARAGAQQRGGEVRVLVNRRADVALAAGADGVHLGFDALDPAEALGLGAALSPGSWTVGVSTHSVEEAARAASAGAHYVQLAPVFDPLSKPAERPALGPDALAGAARALAAHPGVRLIAQGGIQADNAARVVRAGAAGVAVTGAVLGATHPGDAAARLRATLDAS